LGDREGFEHLVGLEAEEVSFDGDKHAQTTAWFQEGILGERADDVKKGFGCVVVLSLCDDRSESPKGLG